MQMKIEEMNENDAMKRFFENKENKEKKSLNYWKNQRNCVNYKIRIN